MFIMTPLSFPYGSLLSAQSVEEALASDATAQRIMQKDEFPVIGEKVGVRLNLNVLKNTGCAVQTLHKATNKKGYKKNQGFYNGEACGYAQAVVIKNAYFNVSQSAREAIAEGRHHKFAMASVDGDFVSIEVPQEFEGIELRFNPKEQHLFVDANNHAVHYAQEVVVFGHRVYARGEIVYHTEITAPPRAGDFPSKTMFKETLAPVKKMKV